MGLPCPHIWNLPQRNTPTQREDSLGVLLKEKTSLPFSPCYADRFGHFQTRLLSQSQELLPSMLFCTPRSTCNGKEDLKEKGNNRTQERKKQSMSAGSPINYVLSKPTSVCIKPLLCKDLYDPSPSAPHSPGTSHVTLFGTSKGPDITSVASSHEMVEDFYPLLSARVLTALLHKDYLAPQKAQLVQIVWHRIKQHAKWGETVQSRTLRIAMGKKT